MAGLAVQTTCAVQEQAEADVMQTQRVIDSRLWEVRPISTTLLPKHIGGHAAGCRGLREEMVGTACRRNCGE